MTVSFALATVNTFAEAPTIRDWPDIIIGDIESVTPSVTAGNVFVFPNAINAQEQFVTDDNVNSVTVKWSFFQVSGNAILLNGVPTLTGLNGPLGGTDDPIQPALSRQITANNDDPGDTQSPLPNQLEDGNEQTVTFRDADLSPLPSGPNVEPGVVGLVNTSVLTIIASDNTVTSSVDMIVQTVNDGTDTVSSGITLDPLDDFDFSTGALNWTSFALTGATAAQNANGLCVTVNGASGAMLGGWGSPAFNVDPPIELVNGKAYRARFDISSNQSNPNAIPLVIASYSSLAWGGNAFWIDVLGGANGFDRPQGIDVADVWITPMAVRIDAWQTGAFQPAEDALNDAQLGFVLPNLNASINFSADSGTLCLATLSLSSGDVDDLNGTTIVGPLTPTDAVLDALSIVDSALAADNALPKSATFVGAGARLVVAPVSGNNAASNAALRAAGLGLLFFGDTNATSLSDSNPIPWNSDVLLDAQYTVASESGGTDPVDATSISFLAVTAETGGAMFVTSGAPGGVFDEQGSPALGVDRVLTGLFFTSNTTLDPDFEPTAGTNTDSSADSIGLIFSAVNRDDLAGDASGADPLLVKSISVTENQVP
jgi:hypothetical protein